MKNENDNVYYIFSLKEIIVEIILNIDINQHEKQTVILHMWSVHFYK